MSSLLRVEWTVLTTDTPKLDRPCSRCGSIRQFVSTGKFRLNANGNRLDAWLIYRCLACSKRWNRTLFERRPARSIPRELMTALQQNDANLAQRMALMPVGKSDHGSSGSEVAFSIDKRILACTGSNHLQSSLTILNPLKCPVRLDKVLARGLSLSRREVHDLAGEGVLGASLATGRALSRTIKEKTVVDIRTAGCVSVSDMSERLLACTPKDKN